MKKEKQVKSYQRRTKSGKVITVKAHSAEYDASEKIKELLKKKGAGHAFEELKKKKATQLEIPFDFKPKEETEKGTIEEVRKKGKLKIEKETPKLPKEVTKSKPIKEPRLKRPVGSGTLGIQTRSPEISISDFKEWYRGTGSKADKTVAKVLRAKLGRAGYKRLEDEAIDNYSSRGHLSLFKGLSSASATKTSSQKKEAKVKEAKVVSKPTTKKFDADSFFETPQPTMRKLHPYSRKLTQVIDPDVRAGSFKVGDASFRMERTKHKDGTYTIMVGQNDGTPGFTKHLASSGSLKSKEEASSYAKKVYTHLTGGKDPSGIRNFATKSSTKKSSVGTGTSKTKAAKSESSKRYN